MQVCGEEEKDIYINIFSFDYYHDLSFQVSQHTTVILILEIGGKNEVNVFG